MTLPTFVSAILTNADNQVLLHLRDDKPGLIERGKWSLPGGRVERGESVHDAIVRELSEEFEISTDLQHWMQYRRWVRVGHIFPVPIEQHVFTGHLNLSPEVIVVHEGQAVRYFSESKLQELQIGFGFRNIIEQHFVEVSE